jgi:hypothetical protein
MARSESDREDLLREATALALRAELQIAGEAEPVTVGFRANGSLSIYFGGETVVQFNAAGQLRRAFIEGLLYKAERGRLVALRRERTKQEVILQRQEVSDHEQALLLDVIRLRLVRLRTTIEQRDFVLVAEVSSTPGVAALVATWLRENAEPLRVASRPNA